MRQHAINTAKKSDDLAQQLYDSEAQNDYYFSRSLAYQTGVEAFQKAEQHVRESKALDAETKEGK